ncbi:MAG: hypothetical protein Ta2B_04300 [Termitinemataceae bacterium]|nr:MAG: hypothetical protein Ta2B_04300 [Termitinemataceae bacterium]
MSGSTIEYFLNERDVQFAAHTIDFCNKALNIFPQDLWALYWIAFISTETGDYKTALPYWEKLINNPLSRSMEILPLAYRKAALCAAEIGNFEDADNYQNIMMSLRNEHDIDVSGYFYTGNLFESNDINRE